MQPRRNYFRGYFSLDIRNLLSQNIFAHLIKLLRFNYLRIVFNHEMKCRFKVFINWFNKKEWGLWYEYGECVESKLRRGRELPSLRTSQSSCLFNVSGLGRANRKGCHTLGDWSSIRCHSIAMVGSPLLHSSQRQRPTHIVSAERNSFIKNSAVRRQLQR